MSILVFSGRKQAGKDTCANFVFGLRLLQNRIIEDFVVSEETGGDLYVKDDFSNKYVKLHARQINFDVTGVKVYSFADKLKQICVDVLGLNYEQVYGTDIQKNMLTQYRWESMPGLNETGFAGKTGLMSGREILEFVGTGIFRRMYDHVWIDSCLSQISRDVVFENGQLQSFLPHNLQLFLINDCRFPNEVLLAQAKGAKVIRLARDPFCADNDIEKALDPDRFEWEIFDYVIYNQNNTIRETLEELYNIVTQLEVVQVKYDFEKNREIQK